MSSNCCVRPSDEFEAVPIKFLPGSSPGQAFKIRRTLLQAPGLFLSPVSACGSFSDFVRKADLARHFQIHVDKRPYACSEPGCSKRFHQRSSLNIHQRIHTGERPYLCEVNSCQRTFSDPSSYSRHQRSHRNDRPFVCGMPHCQQKILRTTPTPTRRAGHCI
ncbi:hypothetical protein BJX62DRAFT_131959 [Aspergillus germanicus]